MTKLKNYVWYVGPSDARTNRAFSEEISEENLQRDVLCADGLRHNLWQCSFHLLAAFQKSKQTLGLQFRVFNRIGGGQIREFKFRYFTKRKPQNKSEAAQPNVA